MTFSSVSSKQVLLLGFRKHPRQPADRIETELCIFAGLRVIHSHWGSLFSPQLSRTHGGLTEDDDSTRVPLPGSPLGPSSDLKPGPLFAGNVREIVANVELRGGALSKNQQRLEMLGQLKCLSAESGHRLNSLLGIPPPADRVIEQCPFLSFKAIREFARPPGVPVEHGHPQQGAKITSRPGGRRMICNKK